METLLYILATFGVMYLGMAWAIGVAIYNAGLKAGDFVPGTMDHKVELLMLIFSPVVLPYQIATVMTEE